MCVKRVEKTQKVELRASRAGKSDLSEYWQHHVKLAWMDGWLARCWTDSESTFFLFSFLSSDFDSKQQNKAADGRKCNSSSSNSSAARRQFLQEELDQIPKERPDDLVPTLQSLRLFGLVTIIFITSFHNIEIAL